MIHRMIIIHQSIIASRSIIVQCVQTTLVVVRPAHVVVNRCPFILNLKRNPTSSSEPCIELHPDRIHQPIWPHDKRRSRSFFISRSSRDCSWTSLDEHSSMVPFTAEPKWSTEIDATEQIDGFINVYTEIEETA